MNPPHLLIRADASPTMGIGHIMRCLALAQAWQDNGGAVRFVCAGLTTTLALPLQTEGFQVDSIGASPGSAEDISATIAAADNWEPVYVVVDGYGLGELATQLHHTGLNVLAIDDFGKMGCTEADLWLDQNLEAECSAYPIRRALLSVRYALLRREFRSIGTRAAPEETARKVLITMGGGDGSEGILTCVRGLEFSVLDLDVTVVLGPAQDENERVDTWLRESRHLWTKVVSPRSMAHLMMEADLAISAAGSTCWELCRTGLPSALLPMAENQRPLARSMAHRGVALNLESHSGGALGLALSDLLADRDRRWAMSKAGQALVDGHGAPRVVEAMQGYYIELRPAEPSDSRWLWQMANDSLVRAQSIQIGAIPWEEHEAWFHNRLASPLTKLFIALDAEGDRVGQLRLDRRQGFAEVSYSLRPSARGHGLGNVLLGKAIPEASSWLGYGVEGVVRPENEASVRAFLRNGYTLQGETIERGIRLLRFRGGEL